MKVGSFRWWLLPLLVLLSACASSGALDARYARTPQLDAPAPTSQQEVIEQELESEEIAEFRLLLDSLSGDERRALVSVISQLEVGYRGIAATDDLVRNPATGTRLAKALSLVGEEFETRLAHKIDLDISMRWSAIKSALEANVDEAILAQTLAFYARGGFCFFDEEELAEQMNSLDGVNPEEFGIAFGMCNQTAWDFDMAWNNFEPGVTRATGAPEGVATYQIQLMRAGKDREYYHQPIRGRYEIKQYGRKLKDFERDHVCGAVYIGDTYALTAAHCVEGWKGYDSEFFAARRIRAGTNDIGTDESDGERVGEIIPINSVVIHASYKDGKAYAGYDIALLKLGRAPKTTRTSRAIPPRFARNRLGPGAKLVQTGWGLTGATQNSQLAHDLKGNLQAASRYLQIGEMELYDNAKCNDDPAFKNLKVTLKSGQICVGSDKGVDACRGDSGGPLVQDVKGQEPVLVGIVSWGIGCGIKNRAAIYTDVGAFYTWILLAKDAARSNKIVYLK